MECYTPTYQYENNENYENNIKYIYKQFLNNYNYVVNQIIYWS